MMSDDRSTPLARFTRRAKQAVAALKDEYEAGRQGDTTAPAPIWATPAEQLDAVKRLLRSSAADRSVGTATNLTEPDGNDLHPDHGVDRDGAGHHDDVERESDAASMGEAIRHVDWARVREATADRTTDVARSAKQLADQVDWAKVQPRAAQVSRAVIAAVASGQLGVGGRLGGMVARTIVDQGGLADRVGRLLEREPEQLRNEVSGVGFDHVVIDTTATDA